MKIYPVCFYFILGALQGTKHLSASNLKDGVDLCLGSRVDKN